MNKKTVRTLFRELLRSPLHIFPNHRERIDAPNKQGIYIIYNPRGRVVQVGRTPRGSGGIRQRLGNHLHNASSFTTRFLEGKGSRLRKGFEREETHNSESKVSLRREVMPIMLNTILAEAGVSPSDVRLVRHQDTRFNQSPFQMWRDDRKMFELYQSHQNVQNRARFGEAYYWASFLGLPNNETMFVGLYRVESRLTLETDKVVPYMPEPEQAGIVDYYDLRLDEHLREFDGKLFVDWGFGMRTWIQRADQQNKPVTELRRQFKEPDFPGHMNFIEPLSRLEVLPKTWIEILRHSKGVYLLTCPRTKEQYVGKAEGDNGFYGRWCEYLQSGHGGNIAVKSREPSDYQVSILEVAGSNPSPEAILEMESRWKSKLQSREMGLNRN